MGGAPPTKGEEVGGLGGDAPRWGEEGRGLGGDAPRWGEEGRGLGGDARGRGQEVGRVSGVFWRLRGKDTRPRCVPGRKDTRWRFVLCAKPTPSPPCGWPGHRRHRATAAYGCCGQALTRFTGHPCTGPGHPRGGLTQAYAAGPRSCTRALHPAWHPSPGAAWTIARSSHLARRPRFRATSRPPRTRHPGQRTIPRCPTHSPGPSSILSKPPNDSGRCSCASCAWPFSS